MKTCGKCGGESRIQPIERYQLRKELMGGMQIELRNVQALVCEKCGDVIRVDIPDRPGLLAAVAVTRSKEGRKLNGDEIRFLRKTMELTSAQLADELKVSDETVSRWENGHLAIGSHAERILRWKTCQKLGEKAPAIEWRDNEILSMNIVPVTQGFLTMVFHRVPYRRREQWREAA